MKQNNNKKDIIVIIIINKNSASLLYRGLVNSPLFFYEVAKVNWLIDNSN